MTFRDSRFWTNYQSYDKISGESSMRCTVDALLYWKLVKEFKFKKFLEIGVYQGLTSGLLLEASKRSNLVGIDPTLRLSNFNLHYPETIKQRATFIEEQSQKVNLSDTYDFILIDGDHSVGAVTKDILKFVPMLEKNGILAVDDFDKFGLPDAIPTLLDMGLIPFLQLEQTEFWIYPNQNQSVFLDSLLTDPISEFVFLYNIDRFGHTVLKAKTIKALTNNIDLFNTVLELYDI